MKRTFVAFECFVCGLERSWECCEDISISAAAWIHAGVRSLVPAQPHDLVNVWGDTDARFHHDGNQTYSNSVPLAIRWPLTRDWVVRGFIPVGLRDTHFGRSAVCRRPFDGLCEIVVRHIFDQVLSARVDPVPFWRYIDRPDLYQLGVRLSTLTSLQEMCEPLVLFVPQFFDRPMVELLDGHLQCDIFGYLNHDSVSKFSTSSDNDGSAEGKNIHWDGTRQDPRERSDLCAQLLVFRLYALSDFSLIWNSLGCKSFFP